MSSDPRYLVLGTAGHIDHGKTTLVRALTGIDTDTLMEEKQRGITINLGFAHLDLPSVRYGIVDVPGHARFIRNMVAGATGIDLVLFVVAADDGVMPQTVEHLQICHLLGVRGGLVALTKVDKVESEVLELAIEDVRESLVGSVLQDCPIVPVDSLSGRGLDCLRDELESAAKRLVPRSAISKHFRMPVDRSFSVKGAGTVVTGTTLSGQVRLDEELELLPAGNRLRVRAIQVHGAEAALAQAGQRIALNLAGVDWQDIQRGDVLARPGWLQPSKLLDVRLELLTGSGKSLRSGSAADLLINTSEIPVRLSLLESRSIEPGQTATVQLRLLSPLACAPGDRFILRSSDGRRTIGGGAVLDAQPVRHVRNRASVASKLCAIDLSDSVALLLNEVAKKPYGEAALNAAQSLGWNGEQLEEAMDLVAARRDVYCGKGGHGFIAAPENLQRIVAHALERLALYHSTHPLSRRGLSAAEIAAGLSRDSSIPHEAVEAALGAAVATGQLMRTLGTYVLPGRTEQLTAKDNVALKEVLNRTRKTATPPQPEELLSVVPVDKKRLGQLIEMLIEDGKLVAAPGPIFFDPEIVAKAREQVIRAMRHEAVGGLTVSTFNSLVGTTRKYGMPLLQLFENEGLLRRDGDLRKLK